MYVHFVHTFTFPDACLRPALPLPTSLCSLTQLVIFINHTVYIVYRPMYILIAVVNMESTNDLVLDLGLVT